MNLRRWSGLILLVVLLCLCGTALAVESGNSYGVEFHNMNTDTLTVDLPKGMVAEVTRGDGKLSIKVDAAATDWAQVMTNSESVFSVNYYLEGVVPQGQPATCPAWVTTGDDMTTGAAQDNIIQFFDNYYGVDDETVLTWRTSSMLGMIDETNFMLIPRITAAPYSEWFVIRWASKDDPDYRYYELLEVNTTFTDPEPFSVPFRYVTKDMLAPCADALTDSYLQVKEMENGGITYKVAVEQAPDIWGTFDLRIKAPAGAVRGVLRGGNDHPWEADVVNGTATFVEAAYWDANNIETVWKNLVWYDANGDRVDYGMFYVCTMSDEDKPWTNYVVGWQPVPASRLSIANGESNAGISYAYDEKEGTLHASHNGQVEVTGEIDPTIITIKPPAGAAYYRSPEGTMGGDGFRGMWDEWYVEDAKYIILQSDLLPAGVVEAGMHGCLNQYTAGPVTLYQGEFSGPDYGSSSIIYWYASKEDAETNPDAPMLAEYINYTNDPIVVTEQTDMVQNEADITEPVKKVTAVGKHPWKLKIQHHPQKGERARHYELQMLNETGAAQGLKEPVVFYMPYPDDMDPDKEYAYELLHFDKHYFSHKKENVTPTAYGLRFVVDKLSPFVISYEEIVPVTPTPEPTATPTPEPTATPAPTATPTAEPTATLTVAPTEAPTAAPTATVQPTQAPTAAPTAVPTSTPAPTPAATPEPEELPQTGDGTPLAWFATMLLLSVLGLAAVLMNRRVGRE